MGALRLALWGTALAVGTPASADEVERWQPLIAEASARTGVPASWIERVMSVESGGRTMLRGRSITSPVGAMGLMQLMPRTWADMRARLGLGTDPYDPQDNILAGTLYLRLMYDRFGYPGLFGAYNAGPGAYGAWLAGARRLPRETVAYLGATTGGLSDPIGGKVRIGVKLPSRNAIFFVAAHPTARLLSPIFVALSGSPSGVGGE